MGKQNMKTMNMDKGSSLPCLKEAHFFEYPKPLRVMPKRNKNETESY